MTVIFIILAILALIVLYDVTQKKHAILHNFPIIGHLRYILETVGPELRQYIVTNNNEERPFSRDQRRWVYASSKKQNNYFGFGTDEDLELSPNFPIIKHAAFPFTPPVKGDPNFDPKYSIPCAKVLGAARNRRHKFRPKSIVSVSAMSYGSLSANAVAAINKGCMMSDCLHNTGEGGISSHHEKGGGLIWQIGTGYFGCRAEDGNFDLEKFKKTSSHEAVKAIEIKMSQGAKPGVGGILPAEKITEEVSKIRGIPMGKDCKSPSHHQAFHDADSLLDFVELLAETSGKPVGIKCAVGDTQFFEDLADMMVDGKRGVDFITIDGGEGGTGAAPLVFSDHVALPFKLAFSAVYKIFAQRGIAKNIVFIGSGKLGWPENALVAFALGVDMLNVARSAMLAIGCIQAQRCHANDCPAGVATQSKWLAAGLDPEHKANRLANYMFTLRQEILKVSAACGIHHPAFISSDRIEILDDRYGRRTLAEVFSYEKEWSLPHHSDLDEVRRIMTTVPKASQGATPVPVHSPNTVH